MSHDAFSPYRADLVWNVTQYNNKWQFGPVQQRPFDLEKDEMSNTQVMTNVSADASSYRLGTVIL